MGKQGRKAWYNEGPAPWHTGQGTADTSSTSSTWSYWHGSWKHKKDNNSKDQPSFPVYSQTPLPPSAPFNEAIAVGDDVEKETVGNYMKGLQKALTACRKADAKMRRIQELKDTRDQQWAQYQRDLKSSFLAQKKQFQRDMETLNQDLRKAMEVSQAAVQAVQNFAQGQAVSDAVMAAVPAEACREAEDAWESLMRAEASQPSPTPQSPDGMLAQALQEAHDLACTTQAMKAMQLQAGMSPPNRGIVTPKRGTTAGAPRSALRPAASFAQPCGQERTEPPSEMSQKLQLNMRQLQHQVPVADPPAASADPYLPAPASTPCPATSPLPRTPPHRSPGPKARLGIKEATKTASAPSRATLQRVPLAEVLQGRRDKLTSEVTVEPTAIAQTTPDPSGTGLQVQEGTVQSFLIDDDHEPDDQLGEGPSPGFGLME